MKTHYMENADCGILGGQDLEIKYTGSIYDGIELHSVCVVDKKETQQNFLDIMFEEEIGKLLKQMIKDMDYVGKNWDNQIKTAKEDPS